MGGIDFHNARDHEPPRAKRKCRVVLRNSRSRSSSHSENDADYLMGLRKTGSSREYDSIDGRFSNTLSEMAFAMRKQRIGGQGAVVEDDDIQALTQSLAGGMNIQSVEGVVSPGPVLATILESIEPVEKNSATDYILEEYMLSDDETLIAADEESNYGDTSATHEDRATAERSIADIQARSPHTLSGLQFVEYSKDKWSIGSISSTYDSALPVVQGRPSDEEHEVDEGALPSTQNIDVPQFLSKSGPVGDVRRQQYRTGYGTQI